ncbi:hypothetical protein BST28_23025, partial [Mycolicibacter kumamotonensis]
GFPTHQIQYEAITIGLRHLEQPTRKGASARSAPRGLPHQSPQYRWQKISAGEAVQGGGVEEHGGDDGAV